MGLGGCFSRPRGLRALGLGQGRSGRAGAGLGRVGQGIGHKGCGPRIGSAKVGIGPRIVYFFAVFELFGAFAKGESTTRDLV